MRQAAHHDLHTTEGLAQVQHLRFILPSGEVDTQFSGMTIRGGVLDDGIREIPGSEIIDGRCALQLPRLAAGCHRYDVLVSGDGTDKPLLAGVIHVTPRVTPVDVDDNAPADYLDIVIPADEGGTITVISESPAWVDDAVEKSLQERGMYVTPVDGETVLTMSAGTSTRDFNYFTFALNSTYISGHLAGSYRLNKIALQTPASEANGTRWMARLCRYSAGLALPLEVLGTSTSTASWTSINASTMECHWNFDGIAVSAADRLILEVYAVDSSGTTVSKALIAYGAAASHGGTEGVLIASGDKLAWRNYSRLALSMSVAYDAGVSVGGIELASRRHFDALAANVAETGKQIADDAAAAQQAREEAEQIASGMTLTAGTITTGAPGSQAAAELKPGSTAGSYTLDMTIPRGDVGTVDTSQAYTWTQPQTYDAMINANGGVRVPLPATAQEAISYEALIEQRAADDWRRMGYYMETLIPSWVTTIVRQMQMSAAYNVGTANVSIKEGVYGNDWQDMLVTMTKAAGISLIGCSTGAWKFANYMGNSRNRDYAAASVWRIIGSDKVSILLGSTAQGYSSATNPAADCYAHPIHWVDYAWDNANYRYPLINSVNGATSRDMTPAWQVTIYPKGYLGSSTSCLLRGTDYGRDVGDQQYMWALAPSVTYLSVAITPRQSADHANVENRWEMFVDGHYVMPMTSLFCGSGNTACFTAKAKAHEVSSTMQVGLRMGGMRIDAAPALGVNDVWPIMERVVMRDATVKPVPEVTASALEVGAEGGEVTLTVSSTRAEAVYAINATMCGQDPAAVWCSQSAEQIPAGGGQITLTLAPNTTGQPRQVWVFVGHHYAQTAVVEINQLAQ